MYGVMPIIARETKPTDKVRDEADVHDEVAAILGIDGTQCMHRRVHANALGKIRKSQCRQQQGASMDRERGVRVHHSALAPYMASSV
jgi:hypothetical protein